MHKLIKRSLLALCLALLSMGVGLTETHTEDAVPKEQPELPDAIARMIDTYQATILGTGQVGDLAFYLVSLQDGQTQTFLVSPKGYLMVGQVYRADGTLLFNTQAGRTTKPISNDDETASTQAASVPTDEMVIKRAIAQARGATGADAVWRDLNVATIIEEGDTNAPLVYAFIDPYCPYCHQQWQQLRSAIETQQYRVRWVPIAVLAQTKTDIGSVLGLLDNPNAATLSHWMQSNQVTRSQAIPAKTALIKNNTLFKRLGSNQVPTLLYQDQSGQIVMHSGLTPL